MEPFDSRKVVMIANLTVLLTTCMLVIIVVITCSLLFLPQLSAWISTKDTEQPETIVANQTDDIWKAPDASLIPIGKEGDEIRYGRELIRKTSEFLGPKGSVLAMSNGMNCQNCHLDAGTKPFGNNYSAVASTYPKLRARSGEVESIEKRINDCFERSLNGKLLNENSREMKAMVSYIKWVGANVPKGVSPKGAGLVALDFLDRSADPVRGKELFISKCVICHGSGGEGLLNANGTGWINPPLWGENSFNSGAGLLRISRFAGYIKANMPMFSTYDRPQLTDEEAWDIAAYVTSLPRPTKDLTADWPDISKKPVDHPFGPFVDDFSEKQHKYGPFKPILEAKKELSKRHALLK